MKAKVLLYDIETSPLVGLTWGRYEQNVAKIIRDREVLSIAWKWADAPRVYCLDRKGSMEVDGDRGILEQFAKEFEKADVVVAHNLKKFDHKVVKSRMLKHGLAPVKPLMMVDTLVEARTHFSFSGGNGLEALCEFLGIGEKLKHQGINMWWDCMQDKHSAWQEMIRYNKHDVFPLLDGLYKRLEPWVSNRPALARLYNETLPHGTCPFCASTKTRKRGFNVSMRGRTQRHQCSDCSRFYSTPEDK